MGIQVVYHVQLVIVVSVFIQLVIYFAKVVKCTGFFLCCGPQLGSASCAVSWAILCVAKTPSLDVIVTRESASSCHCRLLETIGALCRLGHACLTFEGWPDWA